jgi:cobaltochelatase CobN
MSHLPWFGIHRETAGASAQSPKVGLFFPRSLKVKGDLALVDIMSVLLEGKGVGVKAVFAQKKEYGGPDCPGLAAGLSLLRGVDLVINMDSAVLLESASRSENAPTLLEELGVPVVQTVYSSSRTEKEWRESPQGLSPSNQVYWVAQPEFNGLIEPVVVAAKMEVLPGMKSMASQDEWGPRQPIPERVEFLIERVLAWLRLMSLPAEQRRVTFLLHNNPCHGVEASIGGGADLDTLESVARLMAALKGKGYRVEDAPKDGKALIERILARKAHSEFRWTSMEEIAQKSGVLDWVDEERYGRWRKGLSPRIQEKMTADWGPFPGKSMVWEGKLAVMGLEFGNVKVMPEPKRGCWGARCDGEVCKILHDPLIAPTHQCLATYQWAQENSDVIVSVGTHGYIEFLPGKSVGMSHDCFPEIVTGATPHLYLYTVKNPSEGILAKRRAYAEIVDHMIPPMKHYKAVDAIEELEGLLEEYGRALSLDEKERASILKGQIGRLAQSEKLEDPSEEQATAAERIKRLHEKIVLLKGSQHNVGLHVVGRVMSREEKRDFHGCVKKHSPISEEELSRKLDGVSGEMDALLSAMDGRYVSPGPAGLVTRGKVDVLPTGRNFYGIDPHAVPTRAAWEVGVKLAEALLAQHRKKGDRYPENVGMVLWSLDCFRADGEQVSQILHLLGTRPVWSASGRVEGVEAVPLRELGRPRIDVTVRTSEIVRDTLPNIIDLIDGAVEKAAAQEESDKDNFVRKHVRAGVEAGETALGASRRLFCAQPGAYGCGVKLMVAASAWKTQTDLAEVYVDRGGYAYGRGTFGEKAQEGFARRLSTVQAVFHKLETDESDPLGCCYYDFQGGMVSAAKVLSGESPQVLWGDTRDPGHPQVRDMKDEIERVVRTKVLNPEWIEGMKRHGYKGASEMAHKVSAAYGWDATSDVVQDWIFDDITRTYVLDDAMRDFFRENNLWALEEMSRRLLEAEQRGVWKADPEILKNLREKYLEVEGWMEDAAGDVPGERQGNSVDILTRDAVEEWSHRPGFRIGEYLDGKEKNT